MGMRCVPWQQGTSPADRCDSGHRETAASFAAAFSGSTSDAGTHTEPSCAAYAVAERVVHALTATRLAVHRGPRACGTGRHVAHGDNAGCGRVRSCLAAGGFKPTMRTSAQARRQAVEVNSSEGEDLK